ncbi:YozQ family protein [Fictibacillus sp. NRS-1165]|uniref:YozQ family protein n=1 Tax=Fictibacillus sp. NRS-1165 TaxID=3144463 RepID=UPI003D1C8C34
MRKKQSNEGNKVGERNYETEDYKGKDQVSVGMATTHEQVSDYYMSGECVPVSDSTEDQPPMPREK